MKILVTGGAEYIGSHTIKELISQGHDVIVFDNLELGHEQTIPKTAKFFKGNLLNKNEIEKVFSENQIDSVIHFAAYSLVGESVQNPKKYFTNNIIGGMNLFETMLKNNVKKIILSSTAAVYGEPEIIPIKETDKLKPTNPYGESKLFLEKLLSSYDKAYGLKYISLRYFNAAGADTSGEIGEDHKPETHLIPIILQVLSGERDHIEIFGDDYPTKDGTCVRDYIHVTDLAIAHILALENIKKTNQSKIYNLGSNNGFSVKEIIQTVKEVTGKNIPIKITKRRAGDPATLIASSDKIKKELNWNPKNSDIKTIIKTAWNWHKNHPHGFKK